MQDVLPFGFHPRQAGGKEIMAKHEGFRKGQGVEGTGVGREKEGNSSESLPADHLEMGGGS